MFEIGSSLRAARMRQELELSHVERDTRIRAKYLRALEDERFDVLPGPAYTKGFLRTYADYLGLDAQPFVEEYNARFAPEEEAAPPLSSGFDTAAGSRSHRGWSSWHCWRRASPSSPGGSLARAATTPALRPRLPRSARRLGRLFQPRRARPRNRRRSLGSCLSPGEAAVGSPSTWAPRPADWSTRGRSSRVEPPVLSRRASGSVSAPPGTSTRR